MLRHTAKGLGGYGRFIRFYGQEGTITGGSRGLGRQMALAFARGADIVIASRKLEKCQEVVAEIEALGRKGVAITVDATNWDEMDRLADEAYAAFG